MEQILYHTLQKLSVAEDTDNLRQVVLLGSFLNQLLSEDPTQVLYHLDELDLSPPASPITCTF